MDWTFDLGWVLAGVLIMAAGGAIVYFYQPIANNLADGVSSFDKIKKIGLAIILLGFLITANLHTLLLTGFVNLVFRR